MRHRRSAGKLEAKLARNYVHEHSDTRHRFNDPNEITEKIFTGTPEALAQEILTKLKDTRTGPIPEYPQGLVFADQKKTGYFNIVTFFDETYVTNFRVQP